MAHSYGRSGASHNSAKRDPGIKRPSKAGGSPMSAGMPTPSKGGAGALPTHKTGHQGPAATGYGIGRSRR